MKKFALFAVAMLCTTAIGYNAAVPEPTLTEHAEPNSVLVSNAPGTLIVDLNDNYSWSDIWVVEGVLEHTLYLTHPESIDEGLFYADVDNLHTAVELLQNHPLVEVVEPQLRMHTMDLPNDPLYPKQWHLDAMGAPVGWANTPQGKGVIVAVIDTGVTVVSDLKNTHVLPGKSFTGEPQKDGNGHGTHVSGTIAQSTNNKLGTAGIAPKATILPVKVLTNDGWGNSDWIAAGVDYAVDEGAQVINLSLGGGYSKVIHTAIQKANDAGVIVVAACGNSSISRCDYPGGLEETIGVSATGPDNKLAFYSSYGKGVDISAPGGDKSKSETNGVLQQVPTRTGEDYLWFQGTSMATPHVAGAAAVLISTGLSTKEVKQRLLDTADGEGWTEKFGHGHLNLEAALKDTKPISTTSYFNLSFFTAGLTWLVLFFVGTDNKFNATAVVTAVFTATGFWFLGYLPFTHPILTWLSTPFLLWPNLVFNGASNVLLWASAAIPVLLGLTLGTHPTFRVLTTGFILGSATHLLWAAFTASITPWPLFGLFGTLWLVVNAGVCITVAMSGAGAAKRGR